MTAKNPRNGRGHRAYRRKREILKRKRLPCSWCGEDIDYSLPAGDPMSFTADHPEALANGGHLSKQDLDPFHLRCNAKKGKHQEVKLRPAS